MSSRPRFYDGRRRSFYFVIVWYGILWLRWVFHSTEAIFIFIFLPAAGALCLVTDEQEEDVIQNRLAFLRAWRASPTVHQKCYGTH